MKTLSLLAAVLLPLAALSPFEQDEQTCSLSPEYDTCISSAMERHGMEEVIADDDYVSLPAISEYDMSIPPCNEEDGSGQSLPCVWDAQIQGNGYGLSYIINPDDTIAMLSVIPVSMFDTMGR